MRSSYPRLAAHIASTLVVLSLSSGLRADDQGQSLSLVEAQPFGAASITATGRLQPVVCARIGSRVSGTIADFGKDANGQMLDAGMTVKAGEVLFRLDEATFRNTVGMAQAGLGSAQAALDNLAARTRPERIEQARSVVEELDVRLADRQRDEQRFRRLVEEDKTLPAKRLEEVQTELASLKVLRKAAQSRLEEAEAGATLTEIAVARARVQEANAALKGAQDDLRDSVVRAPFDGLVTHRYKSPGDYAAGNPHTDVIELMAMDRIEAELRLPEAYFKLVQAGKTMVALRSPLLERELKLPVGRVVAAVDSATGTFTIRVPVPPGSVAGEAAGQAEGRGGVVPGMFVTADVRLEGQAQGVLVPLRAIIEKDGASAVFVAREGKMVRQVVDVGDRLTESAVIKKGLAHGEKVLVGPAEAMKDGAPLPEYLARPK